MGRAEARPAIQTDDPTGQFVAFDSTEALPFEVGFAAYPGVATGAANEFSFDQLAGAQAFSAQLAEDLFAMLVSPYTAPLHAGGGVGKGDDLGLKTAIYSLLAAQ